MTDKLFVSIILRKDDRFRTIYTGKDGFVIDTNTYPYSIIEEIEAEITGEANISGKTKERLPVGRITVRLKGRVTIEFEALNPLEKAERLALIVNSHLRNSGRPLLSPAESTARRIRFTKEQ